MHQLSIDGEFGLEYLQYLALYGMKIANCSVGTPLAYSDPSASIVGVGAII
ncbi:hypothetical protein [Arenicella xantha]|uniref:hypothetical protein n=1 Tax=Arenicella xantha TaxID=644221 RepID=UPI00147539D9|nr:hypothetical protein [Arenicella xantha]